MSGQVTQSLPYESNIYLSLGGAPALGVLPADVTCKFRKQGQTSLTSKTLTSTSWVEIGLGYYALKWSAVDLNTVGSFLFTLSGPDFDNFTHAELSVVAPSSVTPPEMCVISGNLRDIGGKVPHNTRIVVRPAEFPARFGQNVIQADALVTTVDIDGQFELAVVRNSVVIIEIERSGIRSQITIPDQASANILDLLPPMVADYTT
jgi:hypothetical protein